LAVTGNSVSGDKSRESRIEEDLLRSTDEVESLSRELLEGVFAAFSGVYLPLRID
jgi:hypothetical protein